MPANKSLTTYRIVLALAGFGVFATAVWVGMRVLQPAYVEIPVPSSERVSFNPEADVRENSFFAALREFVVGKIETGAVGNPSPFVGMGSASQLQEGQESRLATLEEIPLQGASVIDIARGSDGSMLALLGGRQGEGMTYEIRSYGSGGEASTFTSWSAAFSTAFTPLAMAQDHAGRVWLGNLDGRMGYADRGGTPVWLSYIDTGLEAPVTSVEVDAVDRVWATDGITLTQGGENGFAPMDLVQQMSEEQQANFLTSIERISSELGYGQVEIGFEDLQEAAMPERLSVTRDGRIGVSTGFMAFRFSLALQQRPDWIDVLATSTYALVVGPNGEVWGRRYEEGALTRVWATGTRAYMSALSAPSQALLNSRLFAQDENLLYAVDYNPTSTSVLWSTGGEEWLSRIIAASGTVPLDVPRKAEVDGEGNVWLLMEQGGLVRIRRSMEMGEEDR
jgi:hypothetical protein